MSADALGRLHRIVRYPDPAIEVLDDRFAPFKIPNSAVERPWTGARWTEGPVYFGDAACSLATSPKTAS